MSAFSATVLEHFFAPRNAGVFERPSGEGWAGSPESGRFVQLQVVLQGDRVAEARFRTYGCVAAIAAGSFLTGWVEGRPVEEAWRLEPGELVALLGGLPENRRFCAGLAVEALRAALAEASCREGGSA